MHALNWLLLALLTGSAAVAAVASALRFGLQGRAERALGAFILFWALTVTPIFVLGYSSYLYRAPTALLSFVLSSGVLVVCARGRASKEFIAELGLATRELLALGPDALKVCWRARSFALVGALCVAGMLAFTLFLTYLAPADESWDGLYYHQPIVGFALQSHGFGLVDLPSTLLAQTINGYPKLGEAFSLWFVLFTDKTLIELASSLALPGLMLACYVLARRYTSDRAACIGWAAVVALVPAISSQLRTTMIDVELWLFALGAVHFATRIAFRPTDAALALLACAMVLGTKSTGLVLMPPIVLVACVRALRSRELKSFGPWLVAGLFLIGTVGALTFARNFWAFNNPFWPVSFRSALLGLDFRGLATVQRVAPDASFSELLTRTYDHPAGGVRDIILRGYGYGVPWILLPFGVLGVSVCGLSVARGFVRRARDRVSENLMLVAFVCLLPLSVSPSYSNARYNVQAIVLATLGAAWLGERWSAERLQEGALAGSIVLSLMSLVWSGYLWGLGLTFADIGALAHHSRAERASMNFSSFQMPASVAAMREAELGPGDTAVFTKDLSFIGVLWNDQFSNRVSYLPPLEGKALFDELARRHARWVAVGSKSQARRLLDQSPEYELVGSAAVEDKTLVFRSRVKGTGN